MPPRSAIVIHPTGFTINGGGEVVCLHTINALKNLGFHVTLASNVWPDRAVEDIFRLGHILSDVEWLPLGETALDFRPRLPRFMAYQRFLFALRTLSQTNKAVAKKGSAITISTQSALFFNPNSANISIVYDTADFLFSRSVHLWSKGRYPQSCGITSTLRKLIYYQPLRAYYAYHERLIAGGSTLFVPLSLFLEKKLVEFGYPHSPTLFPPVDLSFTPRTLKRAVAIQVARIVPSKRLEDFIAIARKLPEYEFYVIGKNSRRERQIFGDYAEKLFTNVPNNLKVIDARIRDRPELLSDSKVYLYTSREPGVNIATCEAMGAGCYPITPSIGGGAEIVQASGVGDTYSTIDEAVEKIRKALESDIDPLAVAKAATIFSSHHFEASVASIVQERASVV